MVFDTGSELDLHARDRLARDTAAWLTTVTPEGQPQTFPIWFLWEDEELLIYSDRRARRNGNLRANPKVSLVLQGNLEGNDVVIIEGEARIDDGAPLLPDNIAYVAKYRERIIDQFNSPEEMALIYNVPIRIYPTRGVAFPA
jgi:PPOX class probable F420-dependent enzyme